MPKLAVVVQKLAVMTCTGVALPLKLAALPRCSTATEIRGTTAAPRNSTGHLTENAITFYSKLFFSDLGLSGKLVSRAIQPIREQDQQVQVLC